MTPKLVGSGEIYHFYLIQFLMHVPELSCAPGGGYVCQILAAETRNRRCAEWLMCSLCTCRSGIFHAGFLENHSVLVSHRA